MGELVGNVEVDELLHGPRHDGGEAGRHSRYGQGEQIVKGRIQNLTRQDKMWQDRSCGTHQAFYLWIVHCQPSGGVATNGPAHHHDVLHLEAQLVDGELHHGVHRHPLLVRVRTPRGSVETRVIPT